MVSLTFKKQLLAQGFKCHACNIRKVDVNDKMLKYGNGNELIVCSICYGNSTPPSGFDPTPLMLKAA